MSKHSVSNSRSGRSGFKVSLFGVLFLAVYLGALLPPVYTWMSQRHGIVLSLPLSVWYMFGVCIFATAVCAGLYWYEHSRKELD
ncbi:hypothetical protein AB0M29_40805 [Streptomyces sp. NPDC051976]|uniref:hypothetical protein n=1 Tax=Streptomyces sp. NPDC051976 TaxID=3154947 RepID=UPI00343F9C7B